MGMVYRQNVLDLGPDGMLILTTDSSGYAPIPAQRYGCAVWHDVAGAQHDRLTLCMLKVEREAMNAMLDELRKRYTAAVKSVRGRVEWIASQVSDDFMLAPSYVAHLGGGRVLLVFSGMIRPHVLRVVDVVRGTVVAEESMKSLAERFGKKWEQSSSMLDYTLLHGAGGGHLRVSRNSMELILVVKDGRIEQAELPVKVKLRDTQFSAGFLYLQDRDSDVLETVALAAPHARHTFKTPALRAGVVQMAGAQGADRCVLSHEKCTIEVIDGLGNLVSAFRPFPKARKEQLPVNLAYSGRYLLTVDYAQGVIRIVDIDRSLVADVNSVPTWDYSMHDRDKFDPAVRYMPECSITDRGVAIVEDKEAGLVAFESFDWLPLVMADAKGKNKSRDKTPPAFLAHLPAWRKPGLALRPARRGKAGTSHLYGLPGLPDGMEWPSHGGKPMLLLCQLDLAAVAGFDGMGYLPDQGGLFFFIAVDEEGEYLEKDFNPVATRVLWVPHLSDAPGKDSTQPPMRKAQFLEMAKEPCELPFPDAAIISASLLPDNELDEYREYLEEKQPDGPASGHRLGGYPTLLQNNYLEAQAVRASTGTYPGEDSAGLQAASHWRLLLQLDSDDEFMWGTDSGMLYFMIHEDDLARRDFSRVRVFSEGC